MKMNDPICGMEVEPSNAPKSTFKGKDYYFCSKACKKMFDQEPEKYAGKERSGGCCCGG
jgi:YHS domain-containing protein